MIPDDALTGLGAHQALVQDVAAIDHLFARSMREPVLLYNHDPGCAISAAAWAELKSMDVPIAVIDVARHYDLGQLLAACTGVRHQSPQVIVLRGGRAVWSASHVAITAEAVREAMRLHGGQASGSPETERASESSSEPMP